MEEDDREKLQLSLRNANRVQQPWLRYIRLTSIRYIIEYILSFYTLISYVNPVRPCVTVLTTLNLSNKTYQIGHSLS